MKPPIPVLRIFDEAKAKEFYVTFLGFKINWEHRFSDGMPLYMEISRGDCVLHLSGHHGDCTPGSRVRIQMENLDGYQPPEDVDRSLTPTTLPEWLRRWRNAKKQVENLRP